MQITPYLITLLNSTTINTAAHRFTEKEVGECQQGGSYYSIIYW